MTTKTLVTLITAAALTLLAGCDVCSDYCATECACAGDESETCASVCLDTMDVYSGDYRTSECEQRLDVLNETCEEG
ncbi:MAG: hypothetical protein KDA24_26920 [Deltaproteobacteria bacterium]|nr:hypothetical protein [Deltaproteobacteria bacterium]